MNENEDLKENIQNEESPFSLKQIEFNAENQKTAQEDSEKTNESATADDSAEESGTGLIESLTEFADSVLEKVEPVIAPLEEAVKETLVEPILDAIAPVSAETPEPLSSSENYKFSNAAKTSVFTKTQPYEIAEIDFSDSLPGKEKAKTAEALAESADEAEQLDVLGVEALPALPKINRARLQVQSPNRIFLYWSIAGNPFETLQKAFKNRSGNYSLVLKLRDLTSDDERLFAVGSEGNWWFDVTANAKFQVEVGFFAQNRPFIRLMSSNTVETPRSQPSPRVDTEADWKVSRVQFARVLDVSGYSHDALPVVFGFGEDGVFDEMATVAVLNQLTTNAPVAAETFDAAEMQIILSALAAGIPFEALRGQLSPALSAWFTSILEQNPGALDSGRVLSALQSVLGEEFVDEFASFGKDLQRIQLEPVFGGSAVHFPEINLPRIFQKLPEQMFPTSPVFVKK